VPITTQHSQYLSVDGSFFGKKLPMKIESQDKRIDELLKGVTFVIPRFQREYSWEAEQVSQFWTDVLSNLSESYFIGSMVVYEEDRSKLAVVDGQQRLTTIAILLCAIREGFKSVGQIELAQGLQTYIEQKTRDNKMVYVLQTETSFPYLQEVVLKNGPPDAPFDVGREEEAIQRAYKIFNDNIETEIKSIQSKSGVSKSKSIDEATKWLSKLRDTVLDLNVIVVTLDNEDDAYLIFETLNTRGKDLALSDLIRNHFTKFVKPDGGVDQSKLKWAKVLETIANSTTSLDPDQFIVHSWQSRFDFVTKAKTFQKVKQTIIKKNAKEHLDRFVSDAEHWRSIFDTDFKWSKPEKDVARSLSALRIFKVIQPTPGILSLIRAYRDGVIKYGSLRDAIAMVEKFHFSFNAITSSRSSGGISGMYSSFGRQVFQANNSQNASSAIAELLSKLREREAPPAEFDAGFQQVSYTKNQSSQKALVQYILKKIALEEKQPFIGETEDLTIEHLLPESKTKDGVPEKTLGQIGNLLLVDAATNEELSNKDFIAKKTILEKRGYKLPPVLAQANRIDEELIAENTNRVAFLARTKVWKV
jgi:hypothetical protein